MSPAEPTIEALLDIARHSVAQNPFDAEFALELLSKLSRDDLDVQTLGIIKHARLVMLSKPKTPGQVAGAGFALARVVTLLKAVVNS